MLQRKCTYALLVLASLLSGCSDEPMITGIWQGAMDTSTLAQLRTTLRPALSGTAAQDLQLRQLDEKRIAIELVPNQLDKTDVDTVADAFNALAALDESKITVMFPPPEAKPKGKSSMLDMLQNNPDRPEGEFSSDLMWSMAKIQVYLRTFGRLRPQNTSNAVLCRLEIPLRDAIPGLHIDKGFVPTNENGENQASRDARQSLYNTVNTAIARLNPTYKHRLEFDSDVLAAVDDSRFGIDEDAKLLYVEIGELKDDAAQFAGSMPSLFLTDFSGAKHNSCRGLLEKNFPDLEAEYAKSIFLRNLWTVGRNPRWRPKDAG